MEKIKDVLLSVIQSLQTEEKTKKQLLVDSWRAIAGSKIAPHTKPSLTADGKLFIWVDQSSLACELNQKYRASLLKRAQASLGEESVKEVHIRVGQLR